MEGLSLRKFLGKASDPQVERQFQKLIHTLERSIKWSQVIRTDTWRVVREEIENVLMEMGKVLRENDLRDDGKRFEAMVAQAVIKHFTVLLNKSESGNKVAHYEAAVDEFEELKKVIRK